MRTIALAVAVGTLLAATHANAGTFPVNKLAGVGAGLIEDVATRVYVFRGHRYCFYFDGWHGPGWYRCGFAWRRGYGWGGVYGWNDWYYAPYVRRFHGRIHHRDRDRDRVIHRGDRDRDRDRIRRSDRDRFEGRTRGSDRVGSESFRNRSVERQGRARSGSEFNRGTSREQFGGRSTTGRGMGAERSGGGGRGGVSGAPGGGMSRGGGAPSGGGAAAGPQGGSGGGRGGGDGGGGMEGGGGRR